MTKVTMLAVAIGLVGCGGGSNPAPGPGTQAGQDGVPRGGSDQAAPELNFAVATASALPGCDAAHKDALVYVQDSQSLTYCDGSSWKPATLKAQPSRIEATITCGGNVEGPIWASYSAAITTAGDVFATGSIRGSSLQASGTSYYAANQAGAATGAVLVQYDALGAANAGWWTMALDRQTLVHSLTYHDDDEPGGSKVWTMTPDKCVKTVSP